MNRGYLLGVGMGLVLFATVATVFFSRRLPPPLKVAFTARLVDRTHAPVPLGERNEVVLKLQNHGRGRIRLESVRFNHPSVHTRPDFVVPLGIPAGETVSMPVELLAEPPQLGQQEVMVTATVTNGRESHAITTVVLWEVAASINAEPALVRFSRVKRSAQIPTAEVRLWYAHGTAAPVDLNVQSLDPAVRVTTMPLDAVENGRHYCLKLQVEIDASLAQPQHRSQIVVRAKGSDPSVIIPVVGWVDE